MKLAALLLLVVVALAVPAPAYVLCCRWEATERYVPPPGPTIAVDVNGTGTNLTAQDVWDAVETAAGVWNAQTGMGFRFALRGWTTTTDRTGRLVVYPAPLAGLATASNAWDNPYWEIVNGQVVQYQDAGRIWGSELRIATGRSWAPVTDPCRAGTYDLTSVLVHELGHVVGLSHSDVAGSVMRPTYAGCRHWTLGADDVAGVRALYRPRDPYRVGAV